MTTSVADNHRHQANKSERASLRAGCMHKVKVGCFFGCDSFESAESQNKTASTRREVGKYE